MSLRANFDASKRVEPNIREIQEKSEGKRMEVSREVS